MNRILSAFSIKHEKEDFEVVINSVEKGVEFSGTNLWILVFAIFIASLGLNVNSTAVVIGAMLVSPLMGPIMGLGMGMAINDLQLLKKALTNYAFALGIGLVTSTIFFLLSPINDASSEILARTSPNIYDVLIALFGGFAGILAMSSRQKGNVIPGVAIATALMPPLCTAGYGLANWNFAYFTGALYLFVINTVFIALATLVTARFLHFPRKHLEDAHDEVVSKRIVWGVVILTLLPSIYFGYDIVQQNRFRQRANQFVENEAVFPNDYLLKKTIDGKAKTITLTYGGETITENVIEELRSKLGKYQLDGATLKIKQGFAILNGSEKDDKKSQQINTVLNEKEKELKALKDKVAATEAEKKDRAAAIDAEKAFGKQIFDELKAQYPSISSCSVQRVFSNNGSEQIPVWNAIIASTTKLKQSDRNRIEEFLKTRVNTQQMLLTFEVAIVSTTH
ncbi:MAG: TIGR00341 family protein [Pyrinomonadaceae bacterium]